ncbi:TIGR03087 family PEP-CTERM/XrtA system glycosyltransferase [Sphingomonas sp. CCH18-H6]|uniref:TIGR03087 family PEP-CTERM/XrtA system glycosyltransferase n=1 Tax=Sphingomonas sp. CCH18-H6 TaxID=1768787 RepID=UPI000A5FE14D|nr:TIGR03087 family PEP-CTERM/XrtA system glycosyltransferase [Sphingomonas sp. CCH18-H6]
MSAQVSGDILFLAHRVPWPPDRGDKIRGYHLLRHLGERARVHLVAFADDAADMGATAALADLAVSTMIIPRTKSRARAAVEALAQGRPVSLTAFADPRVTAAVEAVTSRTPVGRVFVFSGQMAQHVPAGHAPVMDFVDVDSAKFADYARAARWPLRWLYAREARLLGAYERRVAQAATASLFVSDAEAALFSDLGGIGRIVAVENGIDTDFFDPAAQFDPVAADGPLIVFTGQMDYPPNIEAVRWFARDILPLVRRRHPDAGFAIVGRQPGEAVRALARLPGVTVTGAVADVRGWLAAAAVVVAPLRIARGVQNKVLEAMAMARPVVASTEAATGIDHAGTLRVGAGATRIAGAIGDLLDDPAIAVALGQAARRRVQTRYAWPARLAPLDDLLGLAPAAADAAA